MINISIWNKKFTQRHTFPFRLSLEEFPFGQISVSVHDAPEIVVVFGSRVLWFVDQCGFSAYVPIFQQFSCFHWQCFSIFLPVLLRGVRYWSENPVSIEGWRPQNGWCQDLLKYKHIQVTVTHI